MIPQSKPHVAYSDPIWMFIFAMNRPIVRFCILKWLKLELILGCAFRGLDSLNCYCAVRIVGDTAKLDAHHIFT